VERASLWKVIITLVAGKSVLHFFRRHLRVVDAGVIPSTLSGHPNAPCVMIAEKISDVIKNTYGTT
jgi:hypothetical protein